MRPACDLPPGGGDPMRISARLSRLEPLPTMPMPMSMYTPHPLVSTRRSPRVDLTAYAALRARRLADEYLHWSSCRNLYDAMVDYFASDPLFVTSNCPSAISKCPTVVRNVAKFGGVINTSGRVNRTARAGMTAIGAGTASTRAGHYRLLASRLAGRNSVVEHLAVVRNHSGGAAHLVGMGDKGSSSTFAGHLMVLQDKWNTSVWLPFTRKRVGAFVEDGKWCNPNLVLCQTDRNESLEQQGAKFVELFVQSRRRTNRSSTNLRFGQKGYVIDSTTGKSVH